MWLCSVSLLCLLVFTENTWAILSLEEEQKVSITIELREWDLEAEACVQKQDASWKRVINEFNDEQLVAAVSEATEIRRNVSAQIEPYSNMEFRNYALSRRVELLSRPGLALLPASDFKQITEQSVHADSLQRNTDTMLTIPSERVTVAEAADLLAHSRNSTRLRDIWLHWQRVHEPVDHNSWPATFDLLNVAAELNSKNSLTELWETQSDWPNGYTEAQNLWSELQPLYRKFQGYVRRKLQERYSNVPHVIPIHLLGSLLGHDWSYIADIIQPEIYSALRAGLKEKNLGGQEAYMKAQEAAVLMGLPHLGEDFQSSSLFNVSCPAILLPSCADEAIRVFTCGETSWQRYLEAHETVFRAAHFRLNAEDNSYIFRHAERISGLAEALSSLGSLQATLNAVDTGLISWDGSDPVGQELELRVMVALKVLPRLPVALASDLCRLQATPNSQSSPAAHCWPLRREIQEVSSFHVPESELWDALADLHFTSHTPYLSEFAGLLLQFELLERVQKNERKQIDSDLRSVLAQGFQKPWPQLLRDINISSVSTGPILRFFKPLISLFDDMASVSEIDEDLKTTTTASTTSLINNATVSRVEGIENSTSSSEPIQLEPTDDSPSPDKSSTMFFALGAVAIGLILVGASLFLVNKRRKKRQVHIRRKIYDPVKAQRHSAGRPTSFSPIVAKRLSENEAPPPPLLATFKETA